MKTKFYLIILFVSITLFSYASNSFHKRPLLKNNEYTFYIESFTFNFSTIKKSKLDQKVLKMIMSAPTETIDEITSDYAQLFDNPTTYNPEIPQHEFSQGNALIDIEYEGALILQKQFAMFNLNSDLVRAPLVINPSLGFSLTSVIYENSISSNLNVQLYTQPRIYCFSYESSCVDEDNNALMDFNNPAQNMELFAPEINLGLILQSENFAIEYSRTTNFNEWGEIEFSFLFK